MADDFDAKFAASNKLLAAAENKVAGARGELKGILSSMKDDPTYVTHMRARAWVQAGQRVGYEGGELSMPNGWPSGINSDEYIEADLAQRTETLLGQDPVQVDQPVVGGVVKAFREQLR